MSETFKIFSDTTELTELEAALSERKDILLISSPSEYYKDTISKTALLLMKKYPERKIFVTSQVTSSIFTQVREKAESEKDIITTYLYAESLSKTQKAAC